MLERLRQFRDRDKTRDSSGSRCSTAGAKEKASAVKTVEAKQPQTVSSCGESRAQAAETKASTASAVKTATDAGGYQLSEQLRQRIQRRVQFSPGCAGDSGSAGSTDDRYSQLLSKLERRQRLAATSGQHQQRRYDGGSDGAGSPYSRLRLLGGQGWCGGPSDSADEATRNGGSRGDRHRGGYASDGYSSESGVYYGVLPGLAKSSLLQKQQQQQQQTLPSRRSTSSNQAQSRGLQQQQARRCHRCYGSADECDEESSAAAAAAAAATAAAEAAAEASQCLSDVETCGSPAGGSLLRQRRQLGLGRQQQRRSDSAAGSYSDNESAAAPMRCSGQQQQRRRGLECVQLPYPGGGSAGRFASLDRAGPGTASLLSSPTSSSSPSAAERRGREIRQLRRELAEARQRASSLSAALNANASAVSAFERRLGGASARLLELTTSARRGDAEINQLRAAIAQMRSGVDGSAGGSLEVVNLLDWPVGVPVSGSGNDSAASLLLTVVVDVDTPTPIGRLRVGASAAWPDVAAGARRLLREFAVRVDPPGGLGLGADSVAACLLVGFKDAGVSVDSLTSTATTPYEQLAAFASDDGGSRVSRCQLRLVLRDFDSEGSGGGSSLDALAFATLVPKAVLQRYICLLAEHRRLVLCGPTGTGKTFLARRLARHMARLERRRSDDEEADVSGAVAEFFGELRRSKQELRAFLAEAVAQSAAEPDPKRPSRGVQVLLLDSLQHLGPLAEARSGLAASRLYIICTVRRGLRQLQALDDGGIGGEVGFRWLLCANHLEPVRGLLGRHLRRQRLVAEASQPPSKQTAEPLRRHQLDDWLPGAWQRVNSFLEARGGGPDATVGPGPLLGCPLDPAASRDWFVSLWNHSLAPRLLAASSMTQSSAEDWEDPADWVLSTWPWPELPPGDGELVRLRSQTAAPDPLMTMLMKLREAAAASGRGEEDTV